MPNTATAERVVGADRERWTYRAAVVIGCLASSGVLIAHARRYLPFFIDDSFISLRYAYRLLHGDGLTWTDGEHVEGYSNPLWVLMVAAGGVAGHDLVAVARVLGAACTIASIAALFYVAHRRGDGVTGAWLAAGAALSLALAGPVAAWTIGGLEQPLLIALLAWACATADPLFDREHAPSFRGSALPSLFLGLLCWTRPDGPLFAAAFCAALFAARGVDRRTARAALWLLVFPALCVAAQLVFRRVYYDDWVPNTYYAKSAYSLARVRKGLDYVAGSLRPLASSWLIAALALFACVAGARARLRLALPCIALVIWTAYVVRIGGDICPQRRHLVPVLWLAAFAQYGLLAHVSAAAPKLRVPAVVAGFAIALSAIVLQRGDPARERALLDTWHWTGEQIGPFLRKAFAAERPLLAVDAAGALPYYYRLPCLDMLGLNDRYIATHPPPNIGTGYVGHELGDGKYVLSRKPDLIAFWIPTGKEYPVWRSGIEMVADPRFRDLYQLVPFQTDDPTHTRAQLWVRRYDSRVGIQASKKSVYVPGFLLAQGPKSLATLDSKGRLGATVGPNYTAIVRKVRLKRGVWSVSIDADAPTALTAFVDGRIKALEPGGTSIRIDAKRARVELYVRSATQNFVRGVRFTRSADARAASSP
jgi:hypothetical protein